MRYHDRLRQAKMKLDKYLPTFLTKPFRQRGISTAQWSRIQAEIREAKILAARALIHQLASGEPLARLSDAEFKVFSQFGDDGIIQYLVRRLNVQPRTFVEFGVENYQEANTRFLLINDNWRGLIMDGSSSHMEAVRREDIYWRYDLTATTAFIHRDNINGLIEQNGFAGELGLLSIDIDGNDYWVWESLTCVQPTIVVAEYSSLFGSQRAVTIPYDPNFIRTQAHYSNLYWGASLKALCVLADRKGYAFVACNSNGNNAYFVLKERLADLRPLSCEEGYVESRFRDSRDARGNLTYVSGDARRELIKDMPLVDLESGQSIRVEDLHKAGASYPTAA